MSRLCPSQTEIGTGFGILLPKEDPVVTGPMGQQQFVLLSAAMIVVVLAMAHGTTMFSETARERSLDALTAEAVDIAVEAQAWMMKPVMLGGGGNSCSRRCDWSSITFEMLGMRSGIRGSFVDSRGKYWLDGSSRTGRLYIIAVSREYGTRVVVTVTGLGIREIRARSERILDLDRA
jgi:hypothetical protein